MPNSKNNAAPPHVGAAATSANDTSNMFFFSFPYSKEPTAILHSSAAYLSEEEKKLFAYEWLNECVIPVYDTVDDNIQAIKRVREKLDPFFEPKSRAFESLRGWAKKCEFREILWNMLEYSITSVLADNDSDFRSDALTMYKQLSQLADDIFD